MPHVRFSPRPSLLRRALVQAFVVSLIPLGTAYAQSAAARVRVAADEVPILTFLSMKDDVLMTPARDTVLDVIYTEGDKYSHRDTNWYWVLLPRDSWGTQRAGWISGRDVEALPPAERPKVAPEPEAVVERRMEVVPEPPKPAAVEVPAAAVAGPEISEVIVNFRFAKSDLTPEAKAKLDGAIGMLNGKLQGLAFALEGHADSTGPEAFNEKLGLARAETVKRYLAEQHKVPMETISVVTYGEKQPAVPNDTREGRAQNRRVVVKVGGEFLPQD